MKRFLAALMVLLLLATPVLAEGLDLKAMDDSSLLALKKAVDMEYSSRIDSEPILLQPGKYIVGKDIKAGIWYARVNTFEPGQNASARISVYVLENDKEDCIFMEELRLGARSIVFDFEEESWFYVRKYPVMLCKSEFDEDQLYKYKTPTGTIVSEGSYVVGLDIPVGTYRIRSAFNKQTQVEVERGEKSDSRRIYRVIASPWDDSQTYYVSLVEGDRVAVYYSAAVFQKETGLNFDFD